MTIAIISTLAFAIIVIGLFDRNARKHQDKAVEAPVKEEPLAVEGPILSWPAKQVILKHESIPEANRPDYDMVAMMTALDTKYNIDVVNSHFRYYDYSSSYRSAVRRSLECSCVVKRENECGFIIEEIENGVCYYPEYTDIISVMDEISDALAVKAQAEADYEHQIALAGVQNELKAIESFKDSIRDEAASIKEAASAYIY